MNARWTKESAINYKARLAAARERGIKFPEFCTSIPRPIDEEGHTWCSCGKCGGTGRFSRGMHNGAPDSATGFVCYRCAGIGWTQRRVRTKEQRVAHEAELKRKMEELVLKERQSKIDAQS